MSPETIHVSVVFALPNEQHLFNVDVPKGATVESAIIASGILGWYPEIDLSSQKIGIYSKFVALTHPLEQNDRIEIYRPVVQNAKTARKRPVGSASAAPAAANVSSATVSKMPVESRPADSAQ